MSEHEETYWVKVIEALMVTAPTLREQADWLIREAHAFLTDRELIEEIGLEWPNTLMRLAGLYLRLDET